MTIWFTHVFAIATGLVAAGITGSAWAGLTGQRVHIDLLKTESLFLPLRVIALVLHAPIVLLGWGLGGIGSNSALNVPRLLTAIVLAGFWCLLQGVVILTALFAVL